MPDKDKKVHLVDEGRNRARKPDGRDDQGDGQVQGHNDDKGEGRGVAGGGKNQDLPPETDGTGF
jgi:hypothetical protein